MRIKIPKEGYKNLSAEKARIIAHLMADGCVFKTNHDYVIKYEVIDIDLLEGFESDMQKVFGLPLSRGYNKSGKKDKSIPFVRLRSKKVYEDLMRYSSYYSHNWKVPREISCSDVDFRREFLSSFFDDEGSVINTKTQCEIRLYSINLVGLRQVKILIEKLGLNSTIKGGYGSKRNVYAIVIKDLNLFSKVIGFNSLRKKQKLKKIIGGKMPP